MRRRVVFADLRDSFDQSRRKMKLAALPIARQVLRALAIEPLLSFSPGHAMPMIGASSNRRSQRSRSDFDHFYETRDRFVATWFLVGMT
ncbi:hypothetical protein [Bradyrhizobium sp. UFLA05-112]